jgi:hypothetical protein
MGLAAYVLRMPVWERIEAQMLHEAVPGTLIETKVDRILDGRLPYKHQVRFSYVYSGQSYQATGLRLDSYFTDDVYASWDAAASALPSLGPTLVWVDREQPTNAWLHGPSWGALAMLLTLFLVFCSLTLVSLYVAGAIALNLPLPRIRRESPLAQVKRPQRTGPRRLTSLWLLALGFAVAYGSFKLGESAVYFPLIKAESTKHWQPHDCLLLRAEEVTINRHRNRKSAIDILDLHYQYNWGGRSYASSRYQYTYRLTPRQRSGIVRRLGRRIGDSIPCYVNPDAPEEAVLKGGISNWSGAAVFMTLILTLTSGLMLIGGSQGLVRGPQASKPLPLPSRTSKAPLPKTKSEAQATKIMRLLARGTLGLSCLFVIRCIWDLVTGRFPELGSLAAAVFLGMMARSLFRFERRLVANQALPQVQLTGIPLGVPRGSSFELGYRLVGELSPLRSFQIQALGREWTDDGDSVSERVVAVLLDHRGAATGSLSGQLTITIPKTAMPSFRGTNARFEWLIVTKVEGEGQAIRTDQHPLTVFAMTETDVGVTR